MKNNSDYTKFFFFLLLLLYKTAPQCGHSHITALLCAQRIEEYKTLIVQMTIPSVILQTQGAKKTNGKDTYSLFFGKDGRALCILHINIWRKTYEKDNFKHGKNCRAGNGSITYFCRLFKR